MIFKNDQQPLVSVIIVNWNSVKYLEKCLEILFAIEDKATFEVIVVDNASYDGSADLAKNRFKQVKFFQLEKNLGFAGANNFGVKHASGRILIFLNPDTEPSTGFIDILSETIINNKNAGAVGCLLVNTDQSIQLSSVMPFPSLLTPIFDIEIILTKLHWLSFLGVKPLFQKTDIESVSVDVISGACLAVRKDIFESVGRFNEEYFMYSEDVDLCFKIRKSGKTNIFTNRCKVLHHGGKSSKLQPANAFSRKMRLESKRKYFRLNHSLFHSYAYVLLTFLISLIRLIIITLAVPLFLKKIQRIRVMYNKWMVSLIWASFSILGIEFGFENE